VLFDWMVMRAKAGFDCRNRPFLHVVEFAAPHLQVMP
jgi:hypothetical protein